MIHSFAAVAATGTGSSNRLTPFAVMKFSTSVGTNGLPFFELAGPVAEVMVPNSTRPNGLSCCCLALLVSSCGVVCCPCQKHSAYSAQLCIDKRRVAAPTTSHARGAYVTHILQCIQLHRFDRNIRRFRSVATPATALQDEHQPQVQIE